MALDGDEVDDDDDRDMLCIPPSLWVNADYRLFTRRLPSVKSFLVKYWLEAENLATAPYSN